MCTVDFTMASVILTILIKVYWLYLIVADYLTNIIFGYLYKNKSERLPPIKNSILLESASAIAKKIRSRQLKCEDVIDAFISRIKEVNVVLNAMVDSRFEDAIREAQKVDALIASGEKTEKQLEDEMPFLGVPYTTKECFSVKGLHQTGGLLCRKTYISDKDAPVIELMKKAGAILLGVTNTPEICMWWECHNNLYGRTRNPYDTTRTPGGSSGGEGSLIASGASVIGIGSDLGGSIRIPSFFNGIFGHKSSGDSVPVDGMIPTPVGSLRTYNNVGPMCRYASDLLPMFKILSKNTGTKLKLDTPVELKSIKMFYMDEDGSPNTSKVHPEIKAAMQKAIAHFEQVHSVKVNRVNIMEVADAIQIWQSKVAEGATTSMSKMLTDGKGEINSVMEFVKWCFFCSDYTLPSLMFANAEKISNRDPDFLCDSNNKLAKLTQAFEDLLGSNGVFLYPTNPCLAPYLNQTVFCPLNLAYTAIFNTLKFPATHCPLGLSSEGLPVGFQVVGNLYQDHLTLAVAEELERAFGGWVSPHY